jgi:hypothetical protein
MTDLSKALTRGWPNARWNLLSETYESLVWYGPGDKPTLEQINAEWASLTAEATATAYRDKRKAAYIAELGAKPDFVEAVGDVIDDLIREVAALAAEPKTPEFKALTDKIASIKARFPKP